jgi:predicted SnoaL-like aldol condensation-catalyzing enzyme
MTDSSDRNKRNAQAFCDLMFNQCELRKSVEQYVGNAYIQQNPQVAIEPDPVTLVQ